jgi:adenine-specific DNA-methyltransferase
VHVLGKLDPGNERWKAKQIAKLDDVAMREDAERIFRDNYDDYGRKLYLIENCIYGVDIQPIAVQIAKMRFFISLIVDQKVNPKSPNLGVRALPNLETKFVAANTLIGIEKPEQMLLRNPDIDKKEAELRKVREKHFTARTLKSKAKCREDDKRLRSVIAELLKNDGWDNTTAKQLAAWDPYDQNAHADFFDPEWMFGVRDGFDVVIGNPPYFNLNTVSKDVVAYLKNEYADIHTGYNDIVYYFLCIGVRFLADCGIAALITSNYFIGNEYAHKLRCFLAPYLDKLINFKDYQVFSEASVHTCISILHKNPKRTDVSFFVATDHCVASDDALEQRMRLIRISRDELKKEWLISDQQERELIRKLHVDSILLGDISIIEKGSTSGMNSVFTMTCSVAKSLKIETELLRRNVKNSDIGRYVIRDRGDVLIYIDNHVVLDKYPSAMDYMRKHKGALASRNEVKRGAYCWYRFERPRNRAVFDANEKIVVPYRAPQNSFALDDQHCFNDGGDIRAIVLQNPVYSYRYILGLLNSQLLDWFFGFIGKPKGNSREYFNKPMALIPIKNPTNVKLVDDIESIVSRIIAAKSADPTADASALEREIDERVYKLYGLTEEEIAIVESASREATQTKGGGA